MARRPTTPGFKDDRYKDLIGRLKARRKELGLSQQALGDHIGRHKQFISRIEIGERRLDVVEIVDYAAALGLDARDLVASIPKVLITSK